MPTTHRNPCTLCGGSGFRYVSARQVAPCECRLIARVTVPLGPTIVPGHVSPQPLPMVGGRPTPTGSAELDAFLLFLWTNACGRKNALKRRLMQERFPSLMTDLGVADDELAFERKLRLLANEANEKFYPVCTGNAGYWWAVVAEDFNEPIGRIEQQMEAERKRLLQLKAMRAKLEE